MAEPTSEPVPAVEGSAPAPVAPNFARRLVGDMTKGDATKMLVGTSGGCVVGWFAMKAGKVVSFATGSGILFLLVANQTGYIIVNWKKIISRLDNIFVKKVEEMSEPGSGPQWVDRLECYVDNTLDRLEEKIITEANRQWTGRNSPGDTGRKVRRRYAARGKCRDVPVFLVSFVAGIALGVAFS